MAPFKSIDPEKLRTLAAQGLSMYEIASCLRISYRWLYQRMKKQPEIRAAYLQGRSEGVDAASAALLQNCIEHKDAGSIRYYLTAVGGWGRRGASDRLR